jgi:hypothetical protein
MFSSNVWKVWEKYIKAVQTELEYQLVNRPIDMASPYVDQFVKGKLQLCMAIQQVPLEVEAEILKKDTTPKAGN